MRVLFVAFALVLFSCNSEPSDAELLINTPVDYKGMVAYVSFNSECPNCLRSKSALLEASTSHSDFKWYALLIDDEDTLSLPSKIFTKYNNNTAKALSKKVWFYRNTRGYINE